MFSEAEKKISSLEYRIRELERNLCLSKKISKDDYNLKVLLIGLTSLGILGMSFFYFMLSAVGG